LWTKCGSLPSGDIQPPQLTSSSNYDKIIPETGMFQAIFKGPVPCPLVKLILTVLDHHVCGYMKAMVYAGQVNYTGVAARQVTMHCSIRLCVPWSYKSERCNLTESELPVQLDPVAMTSFSI
jgi:predicted anti-sigma-YlaC factor YlaD